MSVKLQRYSDLITLVLLPVILFIILIYYFKRNGYNLGIISASFVAFISFILLRIGNRMTTIAVFNSDICGLLKIVEDLELITVYKDLYENPSNIRPGWSEYIKSSSEDYFTIFSKNSSNMGFLKPKTVSEITYFYLYLKCSRDARRRLISWDQEGVDEKDKKNDIKYTIKMMKQFIEHGIKALELLGFDDENQLKNFRKLRDNEDVKKILGNQDTTRNTGSIL